LYLVQCVLRIDKLAETIENIKHPEKHLLREGKYFVIF